MVLLPGLAGGSACSCVFSIGLHQFHAFPVILLGQVPGTVGAWALPIGWAFAWWGIVLYWVAAALYAVQAAPLLRPTRRAI